MCLFNHERPSSIPPALTCEGRGTACHQRFSRSSLSITTEPTSELNLSDLSTAPVQKRKWFHLRHRRHHQQFSSPAVIADSWSRQCHRSSHRHRRRRHMPAPIRCTPPAAGRAAEGRGAITDGPAANGITVTRARRPDLIPATIAASAAPAPVPPPWRFS